MKLRSILFTFIAATGFATLASATVNAQVYDNPDPVTTKYAKQQGPCSDPWVSLAIRTVTGRVAVQGQGSFGECNTLMYNGGSWSNYNTLAQGVKLALGNMTSASIRFTVARSGGQATISLFDGRTNVGTTIVKLVGNDGSSLIGNDSAGIVTTGGINYKVMTVGNEKKVNLGKSTLTIKTR